MTDTEYHRLLCEIGDYHNQKWLPIDRLLRNWVGGLIAGMALLILAGRDALWIGLVVLGGSAAGMAATAYVHAGRTRHLLELHQRALSMMREQL